MLDANASPAPSATPLLLVDVDGVLNAIVGNPSQRRREELSEAPFEIEFLPHGLPIRVPHETRERIATLETLFECVWATSWEESTRSDLAPHLGFGADWPFIRFKDDFPMSGTWKPPAVKWFAELPENSTRPLVWIDDDLEPDALEWAADRMRSGPHTLMIRPDGDIGLSTA